MRHAVMLSLLALGCGPRKSVVAPGPAIPPAAPVCAAAGQSAPLIVEWPSAARSKIEARAKSGLVLLHYEGCNIEVLAHCSVTGAYGWSGTTRKRDRLVLSDRDELYANVPLGAASLEGKLAHSGSLTVDVTTVGRYEASRTAIATSELQGEECDRVTHVVTGIAIGAFRFAAGSSAKVGGGAGAFGAKAGGETSSTQEVLAEDGDESACATASAGSTTPPAECAAPLRLELVRIGTQKKTVPDCGKGTAWDGSKCRDADAPATCTTSEVSLPVCSKACAADDAPACVALGTIYERRSEGAFAAAAYGKACDRGVGAGCGSLAAMHVDGDGVTKDTAHAESLFARGCDLHHAESCTWLGHLHRMNLAKASDAVTSTAFYTRGCDSGDGFACYWLADAYLEGRGTAKDPERALLILRRLCSEKHALSCMRLESIKH